MSLGFRLGHDAEDALGQGKGGGCRLCTFQNFPDIRQMAVGMGVMGSIVMVVMPVSMVVYPLCVGLLAGRLAVVQADIEITTGNAVRVFARYMAVKLFFQVQARQSGLHFLPARAQIKQSRHSHVAADTARPFPIKIPTHFSICLPTPSMRQAATAAPNPLSIFTTVTPSAQEVSMPSRGARPWNAAP